MSSWLIVTLLLTSFVHQESAPTLDETTKWLTENLPTMSTVSSRKNGKEFSWEITKLTIENCVGQMVIQQHLNYQGVESHTTMKYRIPFAKLNVDAVKTGHDKFTNVTTQPDMYVELTTEKEANLITRESLRQASFSSPSISTDRLSTMFFLVDTAENSQRVQNGLKRLVTLCRQSAAKQPF